jgi:hypothetical protein
MDVAITLLVMKGPCGFCGTGNHERCCIGIKHIGRHEKFPNGVVWACGCEADSCQPGRRKCAYCNNTNTDEVNPETWECIDVEGCHALVEERRANDPLLVQLREIQEITMAKIESDKAEKKAAAKPKTGTCVCGCAGETKGGKFLPGHDARFVSALVGQVSDAKFTAKAEQAARKSLTGAGASEKLVAKFDQSIGLAKD